MKKLLRLIPLNAGLLLILILLILSSGCVSPPAVIVEPEIIELYRDKIVPVPERLTKQVEMPKLPANPDTLSLGAVYRATVVRLMIANGQLKEIGDLK